MGFSYSFTLSVRFTHVIAHGCNLFIPVAVLCDCHYFSALVLVDIVVYFRCWSVRGIVALNIHVQILCEQVFMSLEYIVRGGISDSYGYSVFNAL